MKYNVEIKRVLTTEGEKFVAFYPALKGAMGGGDTPKEALQILEEEAKILKEFMLEEGEALPPEDLETFDNDYSGRITLRLGKNNHKKAVQQAKQENVSLNQWINDAISFKLGECITNAIVLETLEKIETLYKNNQYITPANNHNFSNDYFDDSSIHNSYISEKEIK